MNEKPVAFITGGSRGIGRATALLLASRGYDIGISYRRDADAAEATAKDLQEIGAEVVVTCGEIADAEVPARILGEVGDRFGRVDVLVANAASSAFKPLLEFTPKHLDLTLHTVVQSFLLLTQAAVPLMEGRPGTIIAITGYDTLRVMEQHGLLAIAKAGMEQMVRQFAVELAPRDIAVNGVLGGFVDTVSVRYWAKAAFPGGDEALDRYLDAATPTGRGMATPEEMAEVIAFLTTPAGRWFRGQNLIYDGGLSLPWRNPPIPPA